MDVRKIVQEELQRIVAEQAEEVDTSPFSAEEQAFLGKFAEKGSQYLGILYSKTDIGFEEFITRAGSTLNLTRPVLDNLIKNGIVSITPYGGYGRNEDYTIKLNIKLDDVMPFKGMGGDDAAAAGTEGGAEAPEETGAEVPEAGPTEWVANYGDILTETVTVAKKVLASKKKNEAKVYAKSSRTLKRLPKGYLRYLEQIIRILSKKVHNNLEREHLVADILDNLAHNFGLTPTQIYRSYIYYKSQNRLQRIVGK